MIESGKFRRKNKRKMSKVEALNRAQMIAFAPFIFQTVAALLEFGILEFLSKQSATLEEIQQNCSVSRYTAMTLLQAAFYMNVVEKDSEEYSLTPLGECFLTDEMTVNNFNFMRDVCYLGANELAESFTKSQPRGLQKYFVNSQTIYPHIPTLPEKARKSWYDFDHYYSTECWDEVLKIIFQNSPQEIFDIGGNTGKFEKKCIEFNKNCKVNIIDLPVNKKLATEYVNSDRLTFHERDVLSEEPFPPMRDAVLMSQFLDCFSEEQIVKILKKVKQASTPDTRIYILEPIIDNQEFEGASLALANISLYFTCMANGNSKMFTEKELTDLVELAGLKIDKKHTNVGIHDYTLLECTVK